MIISVVDRVENIVGKGENTGYQHFLLSHNVLKRLLSQTREKVSLCESGLMTRLYYKLPSSADIKKLIKIM